MKRWVFAFRVEPPDATVSVRFGSSVMFGWYSRVLRQWYQVIPGGSLEKIPEPEMLFLDDEYARNNSRINPPRNVNPRVRLRPRKQKAEQLCLL